MIKIKDSKSIHQMAKNIWNKNNFKKLTSSVLNDWTAVMGPKISSLVKTMSLVKLVRTVGW